jgi:hypothetical protein
VPLLINGGEVKSGKAYEIRHPKSGEVVSHFHGASKEDLYVLLHGRKGHVTCGND